MNRFQKLLESEIEDGDEPVGYYDADGSFVNLDDEHGSWLSRADEGFTLEAGNRLWHYWPDTRRPGLHVTLPNGQWEERVGGEGMMFLLRRHPDVNMDVLNWIEGINAHLDRESGRDYSSQIKYIAPSLTAQAEGKRLRAAKALAAKKYKDDPRYDEIMAAYWDEIAAANTLDRNARGHLHRR